MIDIYSIDIDKLYADTDLTPHMEDYIETIAILSEKNRIVRVKDIAALLKIKMPSVTSALNKLRDLELIDYEKYGFIELTEKGRMIAKSVMSRHQCLKEFFSKVLNIPEDNAEKEACKIEHHITPEACKRIHRLIVYVNSNDTRKNDWLKFLGRQ